MNKYLYTGPQSGVTLRIPEGEEFKDLDVLLFPNAVVELPSDNDWVKSMVEMGHLTQQEEPKPTPKKTAPTTEDK